MWKKISEWFVIHFGRKNKKNDGEPWVEMKGGVIDPTHGLRIELDWNEAFVKQLKEAGITGRSDDEIVHRWLDRVVTQMDERFERMGGDSEFK